MARRGEELREQLLWTAKEVFLELGFAGASMDEVARRAGASKRSLYAHFTSKEELFLAVIELLRGLFLARIRMPEDYSTRPVEAVTIFLARYLETMLYGPSMQMIRITTAELARFPDGAAKHHDVLFVEAETRLTRYLSATCGLAARAAADTAQRMIAQVVFARFARGLFGLDELDDEFDDAALSPKIDLRAIRRIVTDALAA